MASLRPLRDYQEACISYTLSALSPGGTFYYALPTGTGKTRIVTGLVERRPGRILVIAHRKELIEQLANAIRDDIPGESVGIMMAAIKKPDRRVTVGTVQTLREKQLSWVLSHGPIDTLLIDECHHVIPDSTYHQLIVRVQQYNPDCVVIGCTATPYRSDKALMQHVLKTCTFERTIPDMQRENWLSPVAWKSIPVPLTTSLSDIDTSTHDGEKDYNLDQLAKVVSPASEFIVQSVQPYLEKRPTVVFCCNVAHAHEMAQAFNAAGIRAASVWGAMPKEDREETLRQWKEGHIQVVCNVGVLTEGFDYSPLGSNPHGLGVVIIARPTMSPSLYLQMLGRGTRLKPSGSCYQNCLVFDLGDNANLLETKQITLPSVMPSFDIETQNEEEFVVFDGKDEKDKKKKPPVLRVNDPLSRSWIAWGFQAKTQTYHCKLYQQQKEAGYIVLLREHSGLYRGFVLTESRKTYPSTWAHQEITDTTQPLIAIMQHCNHVVARVGMKHMVERKRALKDWRSQEISEKQARFIKTLDASIDPTTWTKGQASNFIDWCNIRPYLRTLWAATVSVRNEHSPVLSSN